MPMGKSGKVVSRRLVGTGRADRPVAVGHRGGPGNLRRGQRRRAGDGRRSGVDVSEQDPGARARGGRCVARRPGAGEESCGASARAGPRDLRLGIRRLGNAIDAASHVGNRPIAPSASPTVPDRPSHRRDDRTARCRQSVRRGDPRGPAHPRSARHHAARARGCRAREQARRTLTISSSSATRTRASTRRRSPTPTSPR